jgi:hypothetical protein
MLAADREFIKAARRIATYLDAVVREANRLTVVANDEEDDAAP